MNLQLEYDIKIEDVDAFIFDFDGVLTNNLVHVDQDGRELVSCSRGDGLAFDVLRKLKKPSYILSTEKSNVVTARANKLKVPAVQGVFNKVEELKKLAIRENLDIKRFFYVGNDVNDYKAMRECGYSSCPADSHKDIKKIATFILKTDGGNGVVREILESTFQLDFIKILYDK